MAVRTTIVRDGDEHPVARRVAKRASIIQKATFQGGHRTFRTVPGANRASNSQDTPTKLEATRRARRRRMARTARRSQEGNE